MSKIMGPNPIKLEEELLLSWTPEQLDYMHDVPYWLDMVKRCKGATVLEVREMESNEEVWEDWLKQEMNTPLETEKPWRQAVENT